MFCYLLVHEQHTQSNAMQQCSSKGFTGLVTWSNEFEQLDVEAYFSSQKNSFSSQAGYWMGISRKGGGSAFASTTDDTLYSGPDMTYQPWSHWSWDQLTASDSDSGKDCVAALANRRFDRYIGESGDVKQINNSVYYITSEDNMERKWGWQAVNCEDNMPAICVVPAAELQCASPPPPPKPSPPPVPPPPQPPSPPVPPLRHRCEWLPSSRAGSCKQGTLAHCQQNAC
jgi:hypothetical protein